MIYIVHYHPNLYSLSVLFRLCCFDSSESSPFTSAGDPSGLQSTGFHQVEKWISSGGAKDGEIPWWLPCLGKDQAQNENLSFLDLEYVL